MAIDQQAFNEGRMALAACQAAVARNPGSAGAHLSLGNALAREGQRAQALQSYEQAIRICPGGDDEVAACLCRGNVLQQLGQARAALASYDRAIALDAACLDAHFNKATLLHSLNEHEQALAHYARALEIKPDFASAFCNRGCALAALKRHEEALADYDRAIALEPGMAVAHTNRGNALKELERHEEAIASHERAIDLDPGLAAAYANRGNSLRKLNRLREASQSYARALAINPNNAKARFSDAVTRLLMGDFEDGWKAYEWRWKEGLRHRQRRYAQPLWLGDADIAGKTVLVYPEQGFGDTLQFCRYAELLAQRGARVLMQVQPQLFALLQNLGGVSRLLHNTSDAPSSLPGFDLHCPLLSLPLAFGTGHANIPGKTPYVFADPAKVAQWQARLGTPAGSRVGLVSSGSPTHANDANRSLPFSQLLMALPAGWTGVCLHKELRDADRLAWAQGPKLPFFGPELRDFSDTAALVACLDLVLTVDTSVAHLAAAMGKPTWILLPFSPDWRWQLDRSDSPWYPSVRLFRQAAPGDWAGVLAQVASAMNRFEAGRT